MKLKELKSQLTHVISFKKPNIKLEQYITPYDIAASIVYTAHFTYNDVENKTILDLCSGTGMLSIAASFFNPKFINCVEYDVDAISICEENFKNFEINNYKIFENISGLKCDVTIMNPPFGTRNKGIDILAVEKALELSNVVYTIHKRSTRNYILNKFENAEIIAEVNYDLERSYNFHKKDKKFIEVDLYRISK